jgi:hypothetical protein
MGHGRKTKHVRGDGSFPRKRSPDAVDGCSADHCQPGLRLAAELDPIADAGAGDPGICNGPMLLKKSLSTADQNFSRPLMRFSDKNVRDLVSS